MDSRANEKVYSNGIGFNGPLFWIGAVIAGFSVYKMTELGSFEQYQIFALPLLIGLILLFSGEGNILDCKNKKLILYRNFIFIKYRYKTVEISDFRQVDLVLFSENQNFNMASRVPQTTTVRSRVYELRLKNLSENLLIAESTDYEKAKEMLKEIAEGLKIEGIDQYKAWRQRVAATRRR